MKREVIICPECGLPSYEVVKVQHFVVEYGTLISDHEVEYQYQHEDGTCSSLLPPGDPIVLQINRDGTLPDEGWEKYVKVAQSDYGEMAVEDFMEEHGGKEKWKKAVEIEL